MRRALLILVVFALGVAAGGITFSRSVPRSILAVPDCGPNCMSPKDLLALVASAGLAIAPGLVPRKELESQRCVAIKHWAPEGRYHMVYFPKRDARNIMELQPEDAPYLLECIALAREHVSNAGHQNYKFISNGPALQHLTYFHFHVVAK